MRKGNLKMVSSVRLESISPTFINPRRRSPSPIAGGHRVKPEILTLVVGGVQFDIESRLLQRKIDGCRLSDQNDLELHRCKDSGHFLYNRDPRYFSHVLNYYRTGKLHITSNDCVQLLTRELNYWGLSINRISDCCWSTYEKRRQTLALSKKMMKDLYSRKQANKISDDFRSLPFFKRFSISLNRVINLSSWLHMDSIGAKLYMGVSVVMVILVLVVFCLETLQGFQESVNHAELSNERYPGFIITSHPVLVEMDIVCLSYFLFDFLFRLLTTPCRLFVCDWLNVLDLLSFTPLAANIILRILNAFAYPLKLEYYWFVRQFYFLKTLRVFRLVRLAQDFKLPRVFLWTLSGIILQIYFVSLTFLVMLLVFSSVFYISEYQMDESDILNITSAIWWTVQTTLLIGSRDHLPITVVGQVIGAMCSVTGVLFIAIVVPIVIIKFNSISEITRFHKPNHKDRS